MIIVCETIDGFLASPCHRADEVMLDLYYEGRELTIFLSKKIVRKLGEGLIAISEGAGEVRG